MAPTSLRCPAAVLLAVAIATSGMAVLDAPMAAATAGLTANL